MFTILCFNKRNQKNITIKFTFCKNFVVKKCKIALLKKLIVRKFHCKKNQASHFYIQIWSKLYIPRCKMKCVVSGCSVEIKFFEILENWNTGGTYKDGSENIFLQKWTDQKILDGWLVEPDKNKKDKSGRVTHICGPSL